MKDLITVNLRKFGAFIAFVFCFFILSAPIQASPITLGEAADFGILGLDSTTISMSHSNSGVFGNLGLGTNNKQNFSNGFITGTYFVDPTADDTKSHPVTLGDRIVRDLSQAQADAIAASNAATGLTPTQAAFGDIQNALTITGNGGTNVLSINSIVFSGSSDILTLVGGANDVFIINVVDEIRMSHGDSAIKVAGGLSASRVLFNLTGTGTPLSVSGGASLTGTYLAPNGEIVLSPGNVLGAIIGAGKISLPSGAQVTQASFAPPVPAPPAIYAGVALLGFLAAKRRKNRV